MKKFNVLVTGVSAIIGYGVAEALRSSKYDVTIIGVSIYDIAAGEQWCDVYEKGPMGTSEQFPKFIYDTIKMDKIPPTVREIASHFKFSSTGTVRDYLKALVKKGQEIPLCCGRVMESVD